VLKGVNDLGVLENMLTLLDGQTIPNVRIIDDFHEASSIVYLADDILDNSLFNGIRSEILEERTNAIVDAAGQRSSSSQYRHPVISATLHIGTC